MHPQKKDENNDPADGLGGSLIDSILNSRAVACAATITDVALDKLTTVAVLSEIPVLDLAYKVYGGITMIRNDLFLKKLIYFLSGCDKKDFQEKTELEQRLEMDLAFRNKVGEDLLLLLERQDHFEKAPLLGKVFAARLREEINEDIFFRLAGAINNASIIDLRGLENSYSKIKSYVPTPGKLFSDTLDDDICQSLYNVGLIRAEAYIEDTYRPNELGSHLIQVMRNNQ